MKLVFKKLETPANEIKVSFDDKTYKSYNVDEVKSNGYIQFTIDEWTYLTKIIESGDFYACWHNPRDGYMDKKIGLAKPHVDPPTPVFLERLDFPALVINSVRKAEFNRTIPPFTKQKSNSLSILELLFHIHHPMFLNES